MSDAYSLLRLYQEQGVTDTRLPRLYFDAFQICVMQSDFARASAFAKRSKEARIIWGGEESGNAKEMKGLERTPQEHTNFGLTGKWRSVLSDIPTGLDGKEFKSGCGRKACKETRVCVECNIYSNILTINQYCNINVQHLAGEQVDRQKACESLCYLSMQLGHSKCRKTKTKKEDKHKHYNIAA